jgi:single-strand DNA-binding protein
MSSVNKCLLIGNLTRDPEIRSTQGGQEIANLTVATSDKWKDKQTGELKEKSEFHKVVVFTPQTVSFIKQYLNKGNKVYVEGSLQTRKWEKDGKDHYSTEIVVQGFNGQVLSLNQLAKKEPDYATAKESGNSGLDDDIPWGN